MSFDTPQMPALPQMPTAPEAPPMFGSDRTAQRKPKKPKENQGTLLSAQPTDLGQKSLLGE